MPLPTENLAGPLVGRGLIDYRPLSPQRGDGLQTGEPCQVPACGEEEQTLEGCVVGTCTTERAADWYTMPGDATEKTNQPRQAAHNSAHGYTATNRLVSAHPLGGRIQKDCGGSCFFSLYHVLHMLSTSVVSLGQ